MLSSSQFLGHRCLKVSQSLFRSGLFCSRALSSTTQPNNNKSFNLYTPTSRPLHGVLPGLSSVNFVRYNSSVPLEKVSAGTGDANPLSSGYIPEPPPIPAAPEPETSEVVLNALGEPTLSSLGLCNYTPVGLVQWGLEQLHVGLDIPWWGAIVAGTLCIRLITFPMVIFIRRNTAHMANHQPVLSKLQKKSVMARRSGDMPQAIRYTQETYDYMKRNKVNPMKMFLGPMVQMPVFISMFLGMRGMTSLPVESMKDGGLLWVQDLTLCDPFYIIPLLTSCSLLLTIELGSDGVKSGALTPGMKWLMRGLPFVMLPFIIKFPSAILMYWFTSNIISLAQVGILLQPKVRSYFNIPELVNHEKADPHMHSKGFFSEVQEAYESTKVQHRFEDRMRADAMKFKEAGVAALRKTYAEDPTKGRPKK